MLVDHSNTQKVLLGVLVVGCEIVRGGSFACFLHAFEPFLDALSRAFFSGVLQAHGKLTSRAAKSSTMRGL